MTTTETRHPQVLVVPDVAYTRGTWDNDTTRESLAELVDNNGDFRQCGAGTRYQLYFTNQAQRMEYQGPIEPAMPRLHMSPQATVIALHPLPQAETIPVRDGDIVVFAQHIWQIREGNRMRGEYPKGHLIRPVDDTIAAHLAASIDQFLQHTDPAVKTAGDVTRRALIAAGVLTPNGDLN